LHDDLESFVESSWMIHDDDGMPPTALTMKRDGDDTSGPLVVPTGKPRALGPDGATLRELTAGALLDQPRALAIVRQILEALVAVHADNRRHGDPSPEHVLVLPGLGSDRVKLTDGDAKQPDPRYAAPETAFGAADVRADVYAVGAVLFELLTGHPPFFADDANALRRLHAYAPLQTLKQRAPTLTFVPRLEEVVARALAKKRDARYQTAADMLVAIDDVLAALEAAAPPPPESTVRSRKPNDSLLLLAKELMPQPSAPLATAVPLVAANLDRHVPELSLLSRVELWLRRVYTRARALDRRIQIGAGAALGVLVLALIIVTCRGGKATPVAVAAAAPSTPGAAEPTAPLPAPPAEPPADPVATALQELDQATTCGQRRAAISKLATSGDTRALPALRKARAQKCVARDAATAIQRITAASKRGK